MLLALFYSQLSYAVARVRSCRLHSKCVVHLESRRFLFVLVTSVVFRFIAAVTLLPVSMSTTTTTISVLTVNFQLPGSAGSHSFFFLHLFGKKNFGNFLQASRLPVHQHQNIGG